jgi:hypothetical protein
VQDQSLTAEGAYGPRAVGRHSSVELVGGSGVWGGGKYNVVLVHAYCVSVLRAAKSVLEVQLSAVRARFSVTVKRVERSG